MPAATAPLTWPCCHWTRSIVVAANRIASAAEGDVAAGLAAARERQRGQQRQSEGRGGREVANVPLERDRLALLAGRGQRRDEVGERGEEDDGAEHPRERDPARATARRPRRRRTRRGPAARAARTSRAGPGKNQSFQTPVSVA